MKNLLNAAFSGKGKYYVSIILGSLILTSFLFTGCKKEDVAATVEEIQSGRSHNHEEEALNCNEGLSRRTLWELQQARAATARYRNINNAIRDGYADISVIVPNMGYHYLKSAHLDATFDFRKPEILVYNREHDGHMRLVAVEYAVPIELSPTAAPSGFTGNHDVWDYNTTFQLWTLHAWVWHYNPEGVFNATNSLVHVH